MVHGFRVIKKETAQQKNVLFQYEKDEHRSLLCS